MHIITERPDKKSISPRQMKRHVLLVAVALSWFVSSAPAPAAMVVEGYNPANHDRFYVGSDKAFIGDPYNWSGVATNGSASWATLVTPDYFLSATHAHPAIGSTLKFYDANNPSGPYETATVASGQGISLEVGTSDVWLGKLTAPVSSNITVYPVYAPPVPLDAVGQIVYTFGLSTSSTASQNQRLGRNVISSQIGVRDQLLLHVQLRHSRSGGRRVVGHFRRLGRSRLCHRERRSGVGRHGFPGRSSYLHE